MISAPYVAALLMANPVLLAVLLAVIIFLLWRFRRQSASERRHRRYRATAERVYTRLRQLSGDGQRMSYLRKINPYVWSYCCWHLSVRAMPYSAMRHTAATAAWTDGYT